MADHESYTVKFSKYEINSLSEVLANYRKIFDEDPTKRDHVIFVAAANLSYKLERCLSHMATLR
jgi:hypothetical protein